MEISYETGLQIWVKNKKSNDSEMLFDIAKRKGIEKQLLNIIGEEFYKDRVKSILALSSFFENNFAEEFSGQNDDKSLDSN